MKSAGKARNNGLYRHIRTSKEIIRNLLNYYVKRIAHREIKGNMLLIQKSLKKRNPDYIGDKGKKREGKRNRYREAELKCTIDTYLTFYNSQRPHRKLNMQTPVAFENSFYCFTKN